MGMSRSTWSHSNHVRISDESEFYNLVSYLIVPGMLVT